MGAFTPLAKVWYPDQNDTAKIDTLMATLASSIENGLQPRLALQEKSLGLKASISAAFNISNTLATVPFQIGSGNGQFNNGFSISSSGVVTIQTPGQYIVSTCLGLVPNTTYTTTRSGICEIIHNTDTLTYCETPMSGTYTVSVQTTAMVNCVAGDTIYVQAATGGGTTTGVQLNASPYATTLSVALVRPTPIVS